MQQEFFDRITCAVPGLTAGLDVVPQAAIDDDVFCLDLQVDKLDRSQMKRTFNFLVCLIICSFGLFPKTITGFRTRSAMQRTACVVARMLIAAIFALLALPFPGSAQTNCVPPPSGLVSWWPGNGNALDIVGGNNGTPEAGVIYGPGEAGQGFVLTGGVGIPVGTATNLELQNFTIEAWIQRASLEGVTGPDELAAYFFGFGSGGYGFGIADDGSLFLSQVAVSAEYTTNIAITDTNFHHVAVTTEGGTVVFYVDGTPYAAPSYNPVYSFATPAAIGMPGANVGNAPPGYYAFLGTINQLSIYNRALAQTEIQAIYDAGSFGKCPESPYILSQPTNDLAGIGGTVTFAVKAVATTPLIYQWRLDGTNIAEETNSMLSLTDVQLAQEGDYSVVVSNSYGSISSSNALLTVLASPVIEIQPQSQAVIVGGNALLSGMAVGAVPLSYQWTHNGTSVPGATNSTLFLPDLQLSQEGTYALVVTNSYGSTNSSNALLTVFPIPFLSNGLVAYYPFYGNATDESGNGNDLTNFGATLCEDRFSIPNQAYYFNGNSFLGSSISPLSQTDDWTVTGWIKPTTLPQATAYAVCVGYDNGSSGNGFAMGISGVGDSFTAQPGNELWSFYPGSSFSPGGYLFLSTNQWYQIAMVRSSGTLLLYVNGNAVTNGSSTTNAPLAPTSFEVGSGGTSRYFNGSVNDVRVYDRPLSAAEVQQLYNYEETNTVLPGILSQPTNETVVFDENVTFTVDAVGAEPLVYQWLLNGIGIAGATNSMLELTDVQPAQTGAYSVVINNSYGSIFSSNAVLTVLKAQAIFSNGLVAYYPFDGNANDESGYGNDLTNYGAILCSDRFGVSNQAYYFNGESFLGSSVSPLSQTDNWTVSAWIQLGSFSETTADAVCVGYDDGIAGDGFAMGISPGGSQLCAFFPGVGPIPEEYTFSSTEQWYQVVMLRSSGALTLYVDGNPVTNTGSSDFVPTAPTGFEVGSGGATQFDAFRAPYFWGSVDDVRVYNRPLAVSEVQQLYNYEALDTFLPVILSQPTNVTGSLGEFASFNVAAGGVGPLIYQWSFDGANIAGATNSTLQLSDIQLVQIGTFAVVISNSYGSVTSSNALLTVVTSPVIESQPQDESVLAGSSAKFSVVASSSSALTYQWTLNRNDIPGATSSTISLINVQPAQAGAYAVVISNSYGSITSSDVLLTVVPGQEILTDGLVAYYPFAGNADDESGNGNDLTDYGATLCADRFGNPNGAYFFDGSSYLGSTNSPLSQIDNWTVTAWIQPASIPQTNGYAVCVGYDNGSSGDGYAMGIGGGQLWVFYPGVGFSPGGYVFLATNQWYHVVMVRSSGALMLYVNGNAVTNGGAIESQPTAPTSFEVGSGGSDRYFQGAVDGVRVYNVAFTALEAQALYNFEATSPPLLVIQSQPTNEMAYIGGTASFTVEAAGMEPLIYQWTFNGTNIAGATNAMLVLMGLQPTQIGTYSVVVGNSSGSVTSSNALLGIVNFPIIEVQPQSQGVLIGGSATLSVTASGTGLTYQWLLNNFLLPGQTDSTLVLSDVNASAAGEYTVLVMNDVWPVISSPAILSVFSGAAFLDASTFTSLGVFNPVTNVVVDVGSGQMSGGASFKGSNVTQAGTSVLVFTFSSFVLDSGLSITFVINGAGSTAVALLSQGNMTIGGVIDAGGLPGGTGGPDANGPGPDGGEGGGYNYQNNSIDAYPGNGGGADSSDLTAQLDGGSAGGTGAGGGNPPVPGSGGGGGGALQIGALGSLTVNGAISVNGGGGAGGLAMGGNTGSGGGGSGGGLLVQAGSVAFGSNAVLSSDGGAGGPFEDEGTFEGPFCYSGGGGGGGRIVVAYSGSGMSNGSITALGGAGGDSGYPAGNGAAGTVVFAQALVPALPSIAASIDSLGKFVLSWPSNATNYVLQTSPVLGERAVWNPVGGAVLVGNDFVLTNRTLGAGGFFRLKGK